jgi:methionine synthase II (cobalamin-independent)
MTIHFQAGGLPVLIGSLPFRDHEAATDFALQYTPEIPLWVQLPSCGQERMLEQFMTGLPGLCTADGKICIDTGSQGFDGELLEFYEEYLAVVEGRANIADSRFVLDTSSARGFFVFIQRMQHASSLPIALKGQITGPLTFGTGITDTTGKAIFYNRQMRDALVKLLALKAKWQAQQLSNFGRPVIIFIDEPAMAGVGSSEFTSLSNAEISQCLEEVVESIHETGALAGVHICANTDWSLVLDSSIDIVNFDAYSYFDRFILYSEQIQAFLQSGRILAWGIVPTLKPEDIEQATTERLVNQWTENANKITSLGIEWTDLISQSLITPSCGMGSLSVAQATKVAELTQAVSEKIRKIA